MWDMAAWRDAILGTTGMKYILFWNDQPGQAFAMDLESHTWKQMSYNDQDIRSYTRQQS
jgi:hypothetical protein